MGRLRSAKRAAVSSIRSSIGDITFGFADGAISVSGLVFGVAAGTDDASVVVLAGVTGACAAAVSMMAGRYLDVQSVDLRETALAKSVRRELRRSPQDFLERAGRRLVDGGLSDDEVAAVTDAMRRHPDALEAHVLAYEVGVTDLPRPSPWAHALWMFWAVLLAGLIPVIPFAVMDIGTARVVSLCLTGILMALVGVMRGRIGGVSLWWSALQTVAVAAVAALIGVLIGRLVSG